MKPEELREKFMQRHAVLQKRHYDDGDLTREEYEAEKQKLWEAYDAVSVMEGFRQPRGFNVPIYWAKVAGFMPGQEKPILVKRSFAGTDIQVECYVTETVAALWQGGKLKIDDIVIVAFVDEELDKAIVIDKVWGV